ncbi:unnamed protein product [Closterium sp. Naga37s-1]|nr:unnamed protein product [Closterium sp. Naga37s-1]
MVFVSEGPSDSTPLKPGSESSEPPPHGSSDAAASHAPAAGQPAFQYTHHPHHPPARGAYPPQLPPPAGYPSAVVVMAHGASGGEFPVFSPAPIPGLYMLPLGYETCAPPVSRASPARRHLLMSRGGWRPSCCCSSAGRSSACRAASRSFTRGASAPCSAIPLLPPLQAFPQPPSDRLCRSSSPLLPPPCTANPSRTALVPHLHLQQQAAAPLLRQRYLRCKGGVVACHGSLE